MCKVETAVKETWTCAASLASTSPCGRAFSHKRHSDAHDDADAATVEKLKGAVDAAPDVRDDLRKDSHRLDGREGVIRNAPLPACGTPI